ncbi:MAG: bifunctional UDP-N-acetylglucosamine diphosphorylase/glucosamine-1-phosphate N-acetyltransferase GlmU [Gammaproteobacteria bacterium]|nr:bifunctional UDP-N-acetylglucosamine diphosphorylase/glucosamine-1-phosphate N-acetyltransferase GlmU [Gammaproteobacteria bacterium]
MSDLEVVILAAGQGTRMRSARPKVLHELAGRPLLRWVVEAAQALSPRSISIVYGHGGDQVQEALGDVPGRWVEQAEQLGTGHAVQQAMPEISDDSKVMILYGDVPLVQSATLAAMVAQCEGKNASLLTAFLDDPSGYGRIVRDADDRVTGIVEHKDASAAQLEIREINTGIMVMPAAPLKGWLSSLRQDNAQGELYLTDVIAMASEANFTIMTCQPDALEEVMGINDRVQLSSLERYWQRRSAEQLMLAGVTVIDPERLDIRGNVQVGRDVTIDVNVVLEGDVVVEDGVHIGANNVIRNARLGAYSEVLPNCVIDEARVGEGCRIGPFARLRPGADLGEHVHVGNYVEIKKSQIGNGSKVNHLTYVGDSDIGKNVNVGAGTITCNYDGVNKHRTVIGDDAFIGSGVELVAPVTVGAGATIGAGSTIGKDAPAERLTLERAKQATIQSWKRPEKKKAPQ